MTLEISTKPLAECIACGSPGKPIYSDLTDSLFGAPGKWSTRQCPDCKLAWLDPQPLPESIGKLYEGYWTHGAETGQLPQPNAEQSSARKRVLRRLLGFLLPWRRRAMRSDQRYLEDMAPGRMVDIGCGMGEFAAGMAQLGWEVDAIDFDEAALAVAARQPGIRTSQGSLTDQRYPSDHFDAITMSNVIEHVPNQVETFAECHRVLRPGGRLIMITPNIESKGHQIYRQDWRGLEVPRHLFLHSASSLEKLARRSGFRDVDVFSAAGAVESMFAASNEIAESSGRSPRRDIQRLARREKIETLLGRPTGEWVVLRAAK